MSIPFHTLNMVTGGLPALTDHIEAGIFPNLPFAAGGASVVSLGTITPGTGFTSTRTVTIAPTGGTGSGLTVVPASLKVVSAAVATGGAGTGYTTNDTLDMGNGVTLTVTATAGAITGLAVTAAGSVSGDAPTNPVTPVGTSGGGTGAKVNLTWGLGTATITNSGNYSVAPTGLTVTDTGPGTGASIAAPSLGSTGSEVIVGVYPGFVAPTPYMVFANASIDAAVRVLRKTNTGFSLGITPLSGTLTAGTVDALLIG